MNNFLDIVVNEPTKIHIHA